MHESTLLQKAHYIHRNPIADGSVETADDYVHSSFRQWKGRPLEVEPLVVDIKDLSWRRSLG